MGEHTYNLYLPVALFPLQESFVVTID